MRPERSIVNSAYDTAPLDGAIELTPEARATFEREWRVLCSCPGRLRVLDERGQLRCEGCRTPILRRHRTEATASRCACPEPRPGIWIGLPFCQRCGVVLRAPGAES